MPRGRGSTIEHPRESTMALRWVIGGAVWCGVVPEAIGVVGEAERSRKQWEKTPEKVTASEGVVHGANSGRVANNGRMVPIE